MCSGVLGLQSVVLLLTAPVLIQVSDVGIVLGWAIGAGLALLAVVGAATLRSRTGYLIGHVVQVAAIALGFVVPVMFVLGAVFGALWLLALGLGARVDAAKVAWAEHEAGTGEAGTGEAGTGVAGTGEAGTGEAGTGEATPDPRPGAG